MDKDIGCRRSSGCNLFWLRKGFWHCAEGEVASKVLCPWDPRKYADMDTLISDRKVSEGSGEWCRLKLVTSYKWDTTRQCIRATSISAIHQWYARRHHEFNQDICRWYKSVQREEDMLTLQKDVYALCDWSLKWQLTFNASKCTHMTYGNAKIKSKYKMKEGDGKVTDIKHDDEVEKDLGVLFDTKLSFRQHIGCTVKKVNRMIGLTRRTFHYMDQEVFRLLFTSLMRPHMDYADCIWSPHLKVDIAQLENAQRRATRLVPDLRDRCYEDRLRALNLPSLLYRRRRMDMIQTFRIMTGIDDLEASDFFTMNSRETRGHGKKIMKQPSRLNLRKFSFSHRVVDDWNSLPSKVVEARDVEQFKAELDEAWKDIRFLHTAL